MHIFRRRRVGAFRMGCVVPDLANLLGEAHLVGAERLPKFLGMSDSRLSSSVVALYIGCLDEMSMFLEQSLKPLRKTAAHPWVGKRESI